MLQMENPAVDAITAGLEFRPELSTRDPKKIGPYGASVKGKAPPHGLAGRRCGEARSLMGPDRGRAHRLGYWEVFGFLCGNALSIFKAGRYFEKHWKVPRRWPEATVEAALGAKDSPARKAIEDIVDRHGAHMHEKIYAAIARGMNDGEGWTRRRHRLVSPHEAAKRFSVDYDEREELSLRTFGAADWSVEGLREDGRDRRREANKLRMRAKRRADGAAPREQSKEKMRPWVAKGVSRATYYRQQNASNSQGETETCAHNKRDYVSLDNSVEHETVSATLRPVGPSAHSTEKTGPSSIGKVSESEPISETLTLLQGLLQRLPAPPGADGGGSELSLSELALLAVYARQKTSGRIGAPAPLAGVRHEEARRFPAATGDEFRRQSGFEPVWIWERIRNWGGAQ
ncbi:hypothetical protein [Methylocystis echinoides]|uniref:Uncharacterized protein n=1 Tax=Methylocystis echinoides TaxID=29468 RepID=A0A9W6LSE5_9HYPH|nr:hypothetical protein [Methylocystis echinoides]GLI93605.1 hypothetical protein LMG27198_25970 [Methylocystis echinoides]